MRFARELELDSPVVGYQGALIREMPARRFRPARPAARPHADAAPTSPARSWPGRASTGLDPHLNHLERFIVRADDPRCRRLRRVHGRRARARPTTSSTSIRHPITKVLAAGEPPLPTELAPLARERFAGVADGHDQPSALPRVRRAGRLEGPGRPLAGAPARDPARGGAGHRRPVERHRDARRGRPRRGDADRAGRGPGGRPLHRAAAGRGGRRPDDRGARPRAAGRRRERPRPTRRGGRRPRGARTAEVEQVAAAIPA